MMAPLQLAEATANGLAAALAIWIARRSPAHRAVAALLVYGVLAAVVNDRLAALVPKERPITNPVALLAIHLDQARLLAWHFACAAVTASAWGWRRAVLPILALAPVVTAAAVSGPMTRVAHDRAYTVASLLSTGLLAWGTFARSGGSWRIEQRVLACLGAGEIVALLTYIRNPFKGAAWTPAQAGYLVAFSAATAVQARALWASRGTSSPR